MSKRIKMTKEPYPAGKTPEGKIYPAGEEIELTFPDGSIYYSGEGDFSENEFSIKENFKLLKKEYPELITHSFKANTMENTKPFGVIFKDSSIGSNNSKSFMAKHNGSLIKDFDDKDIAKDYAKRMRRTLSPGERTHYKMTYVTVTL